MKLSPKVLMPLLAATTAVAFASPAFAWDLQRVTLSSACVEGQKLTGHIGSYNDVDATVDLVVVSRTNGGAWSQTGGSTSVRISPPSTETPFSVDVVIHPGSTYQVQIKDAHGAHVVQGTGQPSDVFTCTAGATASPTPSATATPTHPDVTATPTHPGTTATPTHPDVTATPTHPDTTATPTHPDTTATPTHPDVTTTTTAPVSTTTTTAPVSTTTTTAPVSNAPASSSSSSAPSSSSSSSPHAPSCVPPPDLRSEADIQQHPLTAAQRCRLGSQPAAVTTVAAAPRATQAAPMSPVSAAAPVSAPAAVSATAAAPQQTIAAAPVAAQPVVALQPEMASESVVPETPMVQVAGVAFEIPVALPDAGDGSTADDTVDDVQP